MWRAAPRAEARHGRPLLRCFSTAAANGFRRRRVYLIAGEPSGDAIGAKVLAALERRRVQGDPRAQELVFGGIGGPLMSSTGRFQSLFPMTELSVMGLVEVLPFLWRFRRRIQETVADIRAFQPDLVLTIDSKGFTFRVLKQLQADPLLGESVKRMHYVAPSVWAYKHRKNSDFTQLSRLVHMMFTILPFENDIFLSAQPEEARDWCRYVGHPAVEDFLETCGLFDQQTTRNALPLGGIPRDFGSSTQEALLDVSKYDSVQLQRQTDAMCTLLQDQKRGAKRITCRDKWGISQNAFLICALVGSRASEVDKTIELVVNGIQRFHEARSDADPQEIHVVLPTISAVKERVESRLRVLACDIPLTIVTDLDARLRTELFQASDLAVAVSGTVVMETTLANLPTLVVFRANRITEIIAKQLAAVRFVSIPNLLLGRPAIPELLFSDCTAPGIASALRKMRAPSAQDQHQLTMALSTLTPWQQQQPEDPGEEGVSKPPLQPVRGSDLVAEAILEACNQ